MATSFPCSQKQKNCSRCINYIDCKTALGEEYRVWSNGNVVINTYPNGVVEIIKYKEPFQYLTAAGNLDRDTSRKLVKNEFGNWVSANGNPVDISELQRSIRSASKRSKDSMYGYICANDWEHFVTLTFDPKKVDRYDKCLVRDLWSKFQEWCKYHNPDCKIIAVPELHKDGAIHFHALMAGVKLTLTPYVDRFGKIKIDKMGNMMFSLLDWPYGIATCSIIPSDNNSIRVANYVVKYITKEGNIDYNAKRYYHTRNLLFKEKSIQLMEPMEIDCLIKDVGAEQTKDTDKLTVYRFIPPNLR